MYMLHMHVDYPVHLKIIRLETSHGSGDHTSPVVQLGLIEALIFRLLNGHDGHGGLFLRLSVSVSGRWNKVLKDTWRDSCGLVISVKK